MARIIGNVKAIEEGKFFLKDSQGHVNVLKIGDVIHEGEQVVGAQTNAKDATIMIDVILAGAGDLVISGNGELQFDTTLLEGVFSHHDEVVYVNSVKEAMAMAASAESEKLATEDQVQKGDVTTAGDETAAGDVLTDTEREGDVFAARTGQITDVTTDLRDTSAKVAEITIAPNEVTLLVPLESEAPVPLVPPVPLVEVATAPILDVTLGEATPLPPIYSSDEKYNLHTNNSTTGDIAFDGGATSVTISLKSYKTAVDDGQILLKDESGNTIKTIDIDTLEDPHNQPVTVSIDGVPFYAIEVQNFVNTENINSEFKVEDVTAYAGSYAYALQINVADLAPGETSDILGDVIVTGLPEGAILSHSGYDNIYVTGSEEGIHFSSDTDPFSWTMTLNEALSDDTSIVASLTSTEPGDGSAMAVVGVYGDNDIIGGAGADQLDGRDGNDTLSGRAGDDTLIGGEGNDSLYGEDGNDTLLFDSNDSIIDGGLGTDTLILTGSTNIDFATWNSDSLRSIEVIDLTDGDHDLINLSNADILNMSSGNNEIYILGDSLDKVDFLDSENWKLGTIPVIETINGTEHTFDVYTNADDPTVTVRVEQVIDTI